MAAGWIERVNQPQTRQEEDALARCIARGRLFGRAAWVAAAAAKLGLQTTLRPRGRPKKQPKNPQK